MLPAVIAFLDQHGLHAIVWLIPTPGMVYVIMFLALGIIFYHRARAAGMSTNHAINLAVIVGLAASIGSHLFRLVVTGDWQRIPVTHWLGSTGTASSGAYLGGIAAVWVYSIKARINAWIWLDLAVTVQPLGEMIGRWSCWLAGDDYGRVSNVPWAIQFPAGSLAWKEHVARGVMPASSPWSLPVHPQQFYLMLNAAVLLVIITLVWRRFRNRPGTTTAAFLILYGATRFLVEFFRDPAAGGATTGLSTPQWTCAAFVVSGVALFIARGKAAESLPRPV